MTTRWSLGTPSLQCYDGWQEQPIKDRELTDACLRAGAQDCVLKDVETLNLKERLLAAMQGGPVADLIGG